MHDTRTEGDSPVDPSRRRFTRGGFAAPVVLGSLVSKPVLGAGVPYICSISGKMSGNTSAPRHRDVQCDMLGRSPGYWKTHTGWVGYERGDGKCPAPTGTTFNDAFGVDAFRSKFKDGECTVHESSGLYPAGSKPATMLQVLQTGGGGVQSLGRAAVASLLNASSPAYSSSYPLTASEVIRMFRGVYQGGTVLVNGSVYWNSEQVKAYFESLYGGL